MEDKKPSARKTEPKQINLRRKQAFSKQLQPQRIGQDMEQATPERVPIDSWRANAPKEGWDKPIPSLSRDKLTDIPMTFLSSSDASASNAPRMDSTREKSLPRDMPRQQVIRQHREQVRVEGRDSRAPDSGFTQTRERISVSSPAASVRTTDGAVPRETAKPASGHSDSRRMPKDHVVKDAVRHAQAAVEKVRDEVNEQPDVSPGQYAEQKVESYTGTVLHKTEAALESAGTALRKRAIRQFQEQREDERLTDRERSSADAEIRREETVESEQPGNTTDSPAPEPPRTDPGIEPVTENGQPDAQAKENAKKHLTYRDRSIDQQTMEPADRNHSAGSSISEEGGRAHAQGQTKRSEWQKNASGLRVQDPYGRAPSASVSKAEDRAVSPAKSILPETEKEAHIATSTSHSVKNPHEISRANMRPVKAVEQTEKTTQQTAKTTQHTIKRTQKAVQTSAKAAQAAKETTAKAAKATAKAGKIASRALAAAIKAIMEGIKALITAIAEGGWMAVLVFALIGAVLFLLVSSFGLFFSNDVSDGRPMTEAIQEINGDFVDSIQARINRYQRRYKPDEIELVYEGDTGSDGSVMNWPDVLGIYAVSTTTDLENPTDVLIVTREKIETLRSIFKRMNSVSYKPEMVTEQIVAKDENGNPILDDEGNPVMETKKTLTITICVTSMDYRDAANQYGFTDNQKEILRQMMQPEYYPLYAQLTGDIIGDGGEYGFGLDINPDLPPSELGYQIIQAAKRYIGRSYASMDCSKFARTAYADVGLTSMNGLSSVRMAEKCKEMGCLFTDPSKLQAGDLIFFGSFDPSRGRDYCTDTRRCGTGKCRRWLHIHHVAIYINDQYLIDSIGGNNSVQIRKLYGQNTTRLKWVCFGRPTT